MARKRVIFFHHFHTLLKRGVKFLILVVLGLIFGLGVPILQEAIAQSSMPQLLIERGRQFYQEGRFPEAAQTLQRAARDYETQGNLLDRALALNYLSLTYQRLGKWDEAKEAIATTLSLLQNFSDSPTSLLAQTFTTQGRLQLAIGQAEEAFETWQKASDLYRKIGDDAGVTGSSINQAQALEAMGFYRRSCNTVLQIFGQDGETCQQLTDGDEEKFERVLNVIYKQPNSPLKAMGLRSLGNLLRSLGQLEQSQKILAQSLAVADAVQSPQDISQALLNLGNTETAYFKRLRELNEKEKEKEAEKHKKNAFGYYEVVVSKSILSTTRIQAQLNQLSLLIDTEQLPEALNLWPKISEKIAELPSSRAAVYSRINLACSLMRCDRVNVGDRQALVPIPEIAELLNTAAQQAKQLGDPRVESYAVGSLGKLYEYKEDWEQAKNLTQQAIALANNAPEIEYQWQWQMGRILRDADGEEAAIAHYLKAFEILDRLRSDLVALNPDIQFSFRESVEPVYRQLVDLLLRNPIKENLIQARNIVEALQLAELDNFFRDACAKPEKVNIDDLDKNTAVIYPIILPDRLEIIVKLPGPDNLRHYPHRGVSESQVNQVIELLQNSLIKRSTSLSDVRKNSKQIYDWLIEPFKTDLEIAATREDSPIKTLAFVLDGSLRNIPMAVLSDGEKFLVERYAVAVTPGLQLIDPKYLPREEIGALIAGIAGAAEVAPSFQQEGFDPLPNVEEELKEVREAVRRSQKFPDRNFIKSNIQNEIVASSFNVVHLATHGKFSSNQENTFILDWNGRINVKDLDNLLRTSDRRSSSTIQLLVLSACQTATGDRRAALGLAGVAIRAGARSTLASLWNVNDLSTAQLMKLFYHKLIENPQLTKAEVLRDVQLDFLQKKIEPLRDYNKPYHWASFILVGNWF